VPPLEAPGSLPKLLVSFLARKKSPKSFVAFGLHLISIFCKAKKAKTCKKQQLALGTRLIG
jgi:hypothetical protein